MKKFKIKNRFIDYIINLIELMREFLNLFQSI
jgi:hypothetical protein